MTAPDFKRLHAQLARYEAIGYTPLGRTGFAGSSDGETAQVGQGDDFHSFGRYRDGDDVRLVDWGSYARTGQLWSRRFTANRKKKLYLAIDGSGSMAVNGRIKWHTSIECALLLHALTVQSDYEAVVLVFGSQGLERVPTGSDGSITQASFHWLEHFACGGPTLLSSLQSLEIGTGGELCVLSDFMWDTVIQDLNQVAFDLPLELSLIRVTAHADRSVPHQQYRDPETKEIGEVPVAEREMIETRLNDFRSGLVRWSAQHEKLFYDWGDSDAHKAMQGWLNARQVHTLTGGVR
jgi:uncharacterized protein (DUF58 family)